MQKFIKFCAIWFFVFAVYVISPVMVSGDSRWTIHTAESIIKEGNTDLNEYQGVVQAVGYTTIMRQRHVYQYFSDGPVLFALPLIYIGEFVCNKIRHNSSLQTTLRWAIASYLKYSGPRETARFKKFLSRYLPVTTDTPQELAQAIPFSLVTLHPFAEVCISSFYLAIAATLLFCIARMMLSFGYALLSTIIFSFCTANWSLASRALWQHSPAIFLLTVALYFIILAENKPKYIIWLAPILGFLFMVRPSIAIFIFTGYVFGYYRRYFFIYCVILLTFMGLFMWYCRAIYGSFIHPYYLSEVSKFFSPRNFLESFFGQILSPGRGIFIYTPIFVFSVAGFWYKFRHKRLTPVERVQAVIIIATLFLISLYPKWHAGWSYGARYFSEMTPFMVYFLICYIAVKKPFSLKGRKNNFYSFLFLVLLLGSFFIHLRGATDINTWQWSNYPIRIDRAPWRVWDWKDLPFLR